MMLRPRQKTLFSLAVLGLTVLALVPAAQAQEVQAQVILQPNDVLGLQEAAILQIKVSSLGDLGRMPDPVFQLENFRIVGGPSQSTSLQFVNGRSTASRSLTWQLMPQKLGKARVHSVRVNIDGRTIELPDKEIEVVEEAPPGRQRQAADPFDRLMRRPSDPLDRFFESPFERRRRQRRPAEAPRIFLQAEISPKNPYVGQQVVYTVYLYTQVNIRSVSLDESPQFKGFWATVIPQPETEPDMVEHEGERFGKAVLLQRALFARRAGQYEIEPVNFRMLAQIPDSGPFGSFMPRNQEIVRQSNDVTINVRELPEAPAGFNGAVGKLDLQATLAPADLEVGEAATLIVTLNGEGHLSGVPAPVIPEIPGIEVFPPQQSGEETLRGRKVVGTRTWSFVLVPEKPGEWELPPIEMPYFQPRRGRFEVAATESLALTARGTTSVAQAGGETVELHPIRTAALPAVGSFSIAGAAPWLFGLPWVLGALVLVLRRRGVGEHLQARRHLLARLSEASSEERPRQAAALIEDAWRDFLQERWDIPEGAASPQWARLLVERGVDATSAEALVKLADDLHYLRYAPKLSAIDDLRADLLERSRKLAKAVG